MTERKKLAIIDSNALVHRAFHALPPLTDKSGNMTNAVYGFTMILLKTLKDVRPDFVVATFDVSKDTFRKREYEQYKAQREKQPDELYQQITLVKQILHAFNISIFEKKGYEADDIIGTIASLKSVDNKDIDSIIITGDQDTLQLVDDNTKVLSPHKGLKETILYNEKEVINKFGGLMPNQLTDYKALRGDPSDNIPGVKGIGHKTAINLLNEFQSLENIYKNINSDKISKNIKNKLEQYKDDAKISKKLATIICDVKIDFDLAKCKFGKYNKKELTELFQKLNFNRLLSQLTSLEDNLKINNEQESLFNKLDSQKLKNNNINYQLIDTQKKFNVFIQQLKKQKKFCFDTETDGQNPLTANLIGVSFSWKEKEAYYLPIAIIDKNIKNLKNIFTNEKIKKIGHNLKFDLKVMNKAGFDIAGLYFDTMLASYLLNSSTRQHSLNNIAFTELGYEMQKIEELIGKGKNQITLNDVPIKKVSFYSCEDSDITWRLYKKFKQKLKKENLLDIFDKIDMPLIYVLANMETTGVKIDDAMLKKLSTKLDIQIKEIEIKAHKIAETDFNLASPAQLKTILFDKLGISDKGIKKTKTGVSTAASELEKLRGRHKIIDKITEFRKLSKLKNTYLDALPKLINKNDNRLHTNYNQTITATGRLSSTNPNLQNIPIRSKIGKQIRKAFVAKEGFKIIKADYSQIELRIAASLAQDKKMTDAFYNNEDIHTQTAAAIFDTPINKVDKEMRRKAKEVNFGVLYGMGARGLAQRTGISTEEAKMFIDKYFNNFKGIKKYIDKTIEEAKKTGYVETMFGRRRYLPQINSQIQMVQKEAERMAVNTPIQGAAADMIKIAMIKLAKKLPHISKEGRMILQVHDELVFEIPQNEINEVAKLIKKEMNSTDKLNVPVKTEVEVGDNWGDTKTI